MTSTDELERLMAEATPLPWKACPGKHAVWVVAADDCHIYSNVDRADSPHHPDTIERWKADAALIVAAVNALPEMLALREENERLRKALKLGKIVMDMLDEHGPSIVPHLLDTDENAGQRFRTALNQETGSFTDDPFNRAVLGLPLKEPGQ